MKSQDIYLLLKIASLENHRLGQLHSPGVFPGEVWDSEDPEGLIPDNSGSLFSLRALASHTGIGKSEVGNIIKRCEYSGLCRNDAANSVIKINKKALLEFLIYGFKYVYPTKPGSMVRGIPTGFYAPMLKSHLMSLTDDIWVWPDAYGKSKGLAIEPLHAKVPKGAKIDAKLYELLALIDAIRLGRAREAGIAADLLREKL